MARESEVGHFHATARVHEDVGRLDVAVHHAFRVRVMQRLASAHDDLQRLRRLQPGGLDDVVQRRALDKFHHKEQVPPFVVPKSKTETMFG